MRHFLWGMKLSIRISSSAILLTSVLDKQSLSKTEVNISGVFQQVGTLDMEDGQCMKLWLKGNLFPVALIKKSFKNEDGSSGILYLASNDLNHGAATLYQTYQKRWQIELYHKSIKHNSSLAKSPTKRVRLQSNHIFAAIVVFCKLCAHYQLRKVSQKLGSNRGLMG